MGLGAPGCAVSWWLDWSWRLEWSRSDNSGVTGRNRGTGPHISLSNKLPGPVYSAQSSRSSSGWASIPRHFSTLCSHHVCYHPIGQSKSDVQVESAEEDTCKDLGCREQGARWGHYCSRSTMMNYSINEAGETKPSGGKVG